MLRIKLLICPHHRHQIFRLRQVDDVMRKARQHLHRLKLLAANLVLTYFVRDDA